MSTVMAALPYISGSAAELSANTLKDKQNMNINVSNKLVFFHFKVHHSTYLIFMYMFY